MKKIFAFGFSLLVFIQVSKAQQYAMDFTMSDCNGTVHNCFNTLDSGNVIIMEFFMTCNACIDAGHEVEGMMADLDPLFPGKIKFYQMGYTNSYSCATVMNFINTNGFNSVPFDSGAALVAYYGGFGMPTLAVIGGSNHKVLYTGVGYSSGDTAGMATEIKAFFNSTAVNELPDIASAVNVFPNPATTQFDFQMNLQKAADVKIELLAVNGGSTAILSDEKMNPGFIRKTFSTANYSPGLYLLKTTVDGNSFYKKVSISK